MNTPEPAVSYPKIPPALPEPVASVSQVRGPKPEAAEPGADAARFDITDMVREVTESAREQIGRRAVAVTDVPCTGPVVIHSDPHKIRQIMTGLMNNAVKLTKRGRIALILSLDEPGLKLTVADTGKGMTGEQINSAMKAFSRDCSIKQHGRTGAGPGLGAVRALVEKLKGKLSIVSKPDQGTIITVSLPLKPV